MSAPVYTQQSGRLYALQQSFALPGYWAGYYASAALKGASPTLHDLWNDQGGVFLFLDETPADFATFVAALASILPTLSPTGTLRMMWISQAVSMPPAFWQTHRLDAVIQAPASATWLVARQTLYGLGGYALALQGASALTLINDAVNGYAMGIADTGVSFYAPGNVYPGQQGSRVTLAGDGAGSFSTQLLLAAAAGDNLAQLNVMLRYAEVDPASPFGETRRIDMPVMRQTAGDVALAMRFDPLHPLLANRSHLRILQSPTFSTALATARGYEMSLTASDGNGALTPARFGFCRTPLFGFDKPDQNTFDYHLAPDGAFTLQVILPPGPVPPGGAHRFMLGLSGIEYVAFDGDSAILFFRSGQPAFVPDLKDAVNTLHPLGSTAYATVLQPSAGGTGLTYFAQPLQAPLFQSDVSLGAGFLAFHPMASGTMPTYAVATANTPAVVPMGAYKWLASDQVDAAKKLEEAVFSPMRRKRIELSTTVGLNAPALLPVDANPYLAVTPQGLIAKLSANLQQWAGVTLANMPASVHKEVEFTQVGPKFQTALQSNQLFFVVSDSAHFMTQSSVRYRLTDLDFGLLKARGMPQSVIDVVRAAYGAMPTQVFENEALFLAAYPGDPVSQTWKPAVLAVAGLMETDIEGWTFQISPRAWRTGKDNPTIMLFKYCDRSLVDLIADSSSWGWQEAAWDSKGSTATTQTQLRAIIAACQQRIAAGAPASNPLVIFYHQVAANPMWNGVLFFNAPVDFTQMPSALQFMAAGIDTTQFFAHHLGFSLTPFTPTAAGIDLDQTAAFGLIHYENAEDLVADSSVPFGFKTMQLQVRFANAQVVDFSAQVELMLNRLLGALLMKTELSRGNNLIMLGSYQRVGGAPSYAFSLTGENTYGTPNSALCGLEVLSVLLQTGSSTNADPVVTQFILSGNLRFIFLDNFDLFSYGPETLTDVDGYLRFGTLVITMQFPRADPAQQQFLVNESATTFDAASSVIRNASLVNNFPLQIQNLIASPNLTPKDAVDQTPTGLTPEDMGFTSISCPLDQTPMMPGWYGLVFQLDLGTLGALAGSVGLTVSLLAAWSVGGSDGGSTPVYLGLRLPNIPAIGGSIPIQGVLKIGFRSFEFSTYWDTPAGTNVPVLGYMLTLRRFSLSVLCWTFPPGNSDIRLFGAPLQPKSGIGWYAAYDKDDQNSAKQIQSGAALPMLAAPAPSGLGKTVSRRLRNGRRTPSVG